jgi:hypothetical protein
MGDHRPLARVTIDAASLAQRHPPRFAHRNKRALYDHVCPPGRGPVGAMTISRWAQLPLPLAQRWIDARTRVDLRADAFDYAPVTAAPAVEWHVNFAHTILFVAYGGPLFAQDELQVAEHPALGSVREWLTSESVPGLRPVTRESAQATPVLLRGVERRCAVSTAPDDANPYGLYGNAFRRAKVDEVLRATRVIDPPTRSNLLAMEAPAGGVGRYTPGQLRDALATAYTGFCAAREESALAAGEGAEVVVHTGHWGTGAYGGDRELMAMLQLIAARAAGVQRLVFHAFDAAGAEPCRAALARLDALAAPTVDDALAAIDAMGFEWGVSDGN